MAKIAILDEEFEGGQYIIDLDRSFTEGYERGDLICFIRPFIGVPLTLNIAIRKNGNVIFRSWEWKLGGYNPYLHTNEKPENFTATEEQCYTVNGLFSGRIKFEGLKLPIGATVQEICPIDVEKEERRINHKIYLC